MFSVRYLWRHNLTSYSCFQTNVLAKSVDTISILFCTHSLYFLCHCTESKLSALHVRISEEKTLNATTQQFITAKISHCALKQGIKHSAYYRAVQNCKNRLCECLVEYEQSSVGARLAWRTPRFARSNHVNCSRIENAHKVRRETFIFLLYIEVQQTFSFRFSLLRHHQMPECFRVNNCCFFVQQFYHATEIGNVARPVSACAGQP